MSMLAGVMGSSGPFLVSKYVSVVTRESEENGEDDPEKSYYEYKNKGMDLREVLREVEGYRLNSMNAKSAAWYSDDEHIDFRSGNSETTAIFVKFRSPAAYKALMTVSHRFH